MHDDDLCYVSSSIPGVGRKRLRLIEVAYSTRLSVKRWLDVVLV